MFQAKKESNELTELERGENDDSGSEGGDDQINTKT